MALSNLRSFLLRLILAAIRKSNHPPAAAAISRHILSSRRGSIPALPQHSAQDAIRSIRRPSSSHQQACSPVQPVPQPEQASPAPIRSNPKTESEDRLCTKYHPSNTIRQSPHTISNPLRPKLRGSSSTGTRIRLATEGAAAEAHRQASHLLTAQRQQVPQSASQPSAHRRHPRTSDSLSNRRRASTPHQSAPAPTPRSSPSEQSGQTAQAAAAATHPPVSSAGSAPAAAPSR